MKTIPFDQRSFSEIIRWLRDGKVIVLPTDTLPGYSADATMPEAVAAISKLKNRPLDKAFLLLVPDFLTAEKLCHFGIAARRLVHAFWPGPLTMLLPRKKGVLPEFFPYEAKLAVRMPGDPLLIKLLHAYGRPLVSTSINSSGDRPLTSLAAINSALAAKNILIVEAVSPLSAVPSTIVDFDGEAIKIIRSGSIPEHKIIC